MSGCAISLKRVLVQLFPFFLLTHVKVKREEASLFFICDISPMYRTLSFRQKKNPEVLDAWFITGLFSYRLSPSQFI
jgi:hypothetical protein